MKRIALFLALLASAVALSGCGLANSVAGTGVRMAQSAGRLVGY
jgi:predicted small secreted protein